MPTPPAGRFVPARRHAPPLLPEGVSSLLGPLQPKPSLDRGANPCRALRLSQCSKFHSLDKFQARISLCGGPTVTPPLSIPRHDAAEAIMMVPHVLISQPRRTIAGRARARSKSKTSAARRPGRSSKLRRRGPPPRVSCTPKAAGQGAGSGLRLRGGRRRRSRLTRWLPTLAGCGGALCRQPARRAA